MFTTPLPAEPAAGGDDGDGDGSASASAAATVQACGVLLSLDADLRVVQCSAVTEPLLGHAPSDLTGRALGEVLDADVAAQVAARCDDGLPAEPWCVVVAGSGGGDLRGSPVEVRVHASGERVVVELEPAGVGASSAGDYTSVRAAMTCLAAASDLGELTDLLANQVRALTGYDRVTVVRYDPEWGSETIAEARREGLGPHLGLRFPAARAPTRTSGPQVEPVQVVADVRSAAVPLVPGADPATGTSLDLSHASLRSMAPGHLDYLRASGVTAALSISIMIDDELWGLIACHHYSGPHRPGHEVRSSAEFFTRVASHLVAHQVRADARDEAARTRAAMAEFTTRLTASEGDVLDAVFSDPAVLEVFGAAGAANLFEGELRTRGVVPDLETLQQIADLLNLSDVYASSTDRLGGLDERLARLAGVADGALRVGTNGDRWGLWLRTDGTRWERWHIEAAEALGRHVSSLLLLRSREQVAMAESMQRSVVLDRAPEFAGVDLVACYRPATSYQLGGDWWDAFELDDRRLVFVVGDVAGHGVVAASAMTQVRAALRAYLYDGHGPAGGLDRLDRLMDGLLDVGVASALVGVIDRSTGVAELASAGHLDPVLVSLDGTAREVPVERRPLLGVGLGTAPLTRVDLSDGSLLILFTDGLVERRGTDTDVQVARLVELAGGALEPRPHDDLPRWADRLLAALDTPDDDTTVLAIRCAGRA